MIDPDPSEFLQALEHDLRGRHVPFSRAALQNFVWAAFPRISDDPDVTFYANEFLAGEPMTPA
jgi:hypothetical protein